MENWIVKLFFLWRERLLKKKTLKQFEELPDEEATDYFLSLSEKERAELLGTPYVEPSTTLAEQTGKPVEYEKRKIGAKYRCRHCPAEFDELWQLANHRRSVLAKQRKEILGRSQIVPTDIKVPKQSKILKVERIHTATRIAATFFIPPNWEMIRVHKPVEAKANKWETVNKIWVCFEPVVVI